MRVVIQRVKHASVTVEAQVVGQISKGLLVLVGVENADDSQDIEWICQKIIQMRIFADENNKMNLSVKDIEGEILLISQFTLHASTKKGNRPSFIRAAKAEKAERLYQQCATTLEDKLGKGIQKGVFGADMKVELLNDGPVTITMDSKNKE